MFDIIDILIGFSLGMFVMNLIWWALNRKFEREREYLDAVFDEIWCRFLRRYEENEEGENDG